MVEKLFLDSFIKNQFLYSLNLYSFKFYIVLYILFSLYAKLRAI